MPIKNTIVQDAIQFTAADRRKHIETALTGVSGSLVEVRDNVYFMLAELPNVEFPDDLSKEVKDLLDSFSVAMSWDIQKEIDEGWRALGKADDYTVLLRDWQDKEILASIKLTNTYMQDYFSNLDKIIQKLLTPEYKEFSLARTLIMESVTNMLNANQQNFERYKNLQNKLTNYI